MASASQPAYGKAGGAGDDCEGDRQRAICLRVRLPGGRPADPAGEFGYADGGGVLRSPSGSMLQGIAISSTPR
jgi:hypothetical protein